jgi:hypothetical protein
MRTGAELIAELEMEAEGAERAGLIIGFENTTVYVWSDDADRLNILNEACDAGGHPIGLIRWFRQNNEIQIQARRLKEFAHDDHARQFIESLVAGFQDTLGEKWGHRPE